MKAYKFLAADGTGLFSRFRWPLPNGEPGAWVESEVIPCRSGVHACRTIDLPFWVAPALYEIELDGDVVPQGYKVVAPRGRLTRRIDAWNDETREEYSQRCIARAVELAKSAPDVLQEWAPTPESSAAGPALMGFMAARMAERIGGVPAYDEERQRQSAWLVERLGLDET
jgi:hypothetical protein